LPPQKIKPFLTTVSLLLIGIVISVIFSRFVPYNMDEFIHYRQIICYHYKYNSLNTFRGGCFDFDLNFLNTGVFLPLRSTGYMGSLPSILYYPLFLVWKSPISARFLGIVFLLIQALILSKIFNIRIGYIFLGLIFFFPYFFQHIVDTGITGFQCSILIFLYFLTAKWLKSLKTSYPLWIALIVFLGIWAKLSFFWLLPGIGILFLMLVTENRKTIFERKNFQILVVHSLLIFIIVGGLSSLLFLSTDRDGHFFADELFSGPRSEVYSLKELLDPNTIGQSQAFKALINPYQSTQRIYHVKSLSLFTYVYDFLVYISIPLMGIILFITAKGDSKKGVLKSLLLFFVFIITFFIILRTKRARFMHHTILSFPFLILCALILFNALREKGRHILNSRFLKIILLSWFSLFFLLNSYLFLTFSNQEIRHFDDFSKIKINEILRNAYLAKNYFYVTIDWGIYYYQALYGHPSQGVLYLTPLNKKWQIDRLKKLSREYDRKLLFIYNTQKKASNLRLIQESFSLKPCHRVDAEAVWQILLEVDESEENICLSE